MKIAFDAKRALCNTSGLGNYSRNLLNALTKFFPGEEYLLFSPNVKEELLEQLNGDLKIFLPEKKFHKAVSSVWRTFGIGKELSKQRVNVFHGLSNEIPLVPRSSFLVPFIVTIHDVIFLKYPEQYPWFDRKIYEAKTKFAVKHADKIIAVSNDTKNDLLERYRVPEKKVEVIYQCADERFFNAHCGLPISDLEAKYNLPSKYILNVGSFVSRKNQKVLIEAFDKSKNKIEEDLLLVGNSGNLKSEIEQLIVAKSLQHRVKIISNISNNDLPAVYRNAILFVYPSAKEGFGIPIVEALLSKVPVITTKGGAMEEAAGKNSLLLDIPNHAEEVSEKMLIALTDEKLRKKMVEEGFAHAQKFNSKNFAEQTMRVYKGVT